MSRFRLKLLIAAVCFAAARVAAGDDAVDYVREVKPLLTEHCYRCHGTLKQKSELRLDTARFAIEGGSSGAAVVPGEALSSLLLKRVGETDDDQRMPPEGEPLTANQFELLGELNRLSAVEYPDDADLRARIKSYEIAFGMQRALPEVFDFEQETLATQALYGLDNPETEEFGRICLSARRLVQRGVRFVQVYDDGPNDSDGNWDTHNDSKPRLQQNAKNVDRPIAGLLQDLKRHGLLDETLVRFMTEFGRTPGGQGAKATDREHHPCGFSVWMAGGGIKGGVVHGATDELGFHAIEGRHYVTDIHATVLHQLGLDSRRLEVPGRKRLNIDHGKPIHEIIA